MEKVIIRFPVGTEFSFKDGRLSVECDSDFINRESSLKQKRTNVRKLYPDMIELKGRCPGITPDEFARIFGVSRTTVYTNKTIRSIFGLTRGFCEEEARERYREDM